MDMSKIPVGVDAPNDINVIIEIGEGQDPIKYEIDKESGALFVDRIMHTSMRYPCNYGFIPHTLAYDGDATDVLLVSGPSFLPGCVVRARPIGVLVMEDQGGMDEKILAVPVDDLHPYYSNVNSYTSLPKIITSQITHFFEHYKDLEPGKWTKIQGWEDAPRAKEFILETIENYKKQEEKAA